MGTPTQSGAGIPMATDIAFAIGMLAMLGNRIPASLKVFDGTGRDRRPHGHHCHSRFYTNEISFTYISLVAGIFIAMIIMNRLRVRNLIPT